jgi:site-specific DNA-methyltransferase (adenine-specific)
MQPVLFMEDDKAKIILNVPVGSCEVSPFNPRRTRADVDIDSLARRMERNGFEITRALWVYQAGDRYMVFAGGNRLLAVQRTPIATVPVVLHKGYTDEEIVGLADQDNENDEYHRPVPLVDVWMDYKRLADMGWTQQRIADAKGVSQFNVSIRLAFAYFPSSVQAAFIANDFLRESHAREIRELLHCNNLAPWLDREIAMLEVIQAGIKKGGTARHFAEQVEHYNGLITLAQEQINALPAEYVDGYLADLVNRKARSRAALMQAYTETQQRVTADRRREEDKLRAQADEAEQKRIAAEREAHRAAVIRDQLAKLVHGDARQQQPPSNIKLLFTDPPYGMDFQSNRRVVMAKAPTLVGDKTPAEAMTLLADILARFESYLADDAFVLVWCDWRQQAATISILEAAGLSMREEVIWDKPNHSSGDLFGAPARKHEKFLFAVKGNPKLTGQRFETVLRGNQFINGDHPTEKPVDLIETIVRSCTEEGDLVVDPFMGTGSVPLTACKLHRDFWGCELDKTWHGIASDRLLKIIEETINE